MLPNRRRLSHSALAILACVLALPQGLTTARASANPPATHRAGAFHPTVSASLHNDTSPPLATMRPRLGPPPTTIRQMPGHVLGLPQASRRPGSGTAPASGGPARGGMPAFGTSFEGVSNLDQVLPPDTEGAVGPNHYMQWVNLHLAVYDKQGNVLLGPVPGNTLFQGFGGICETNNDGDPVVRYDAMADRWFATQFAIGADFHQCVAVSQTGDPTQSWYRYDFLMSSTLFNDYPKFGVWPDAYYMSFNEFAGNTEVGAGAAAMERAKMLTGQPARMVQFDESTVNAGYTGLLPSDLDGAPPPAGAPNYFAQASDVAAGVFPTDRLSFWGFHVDWTTPTNSTFGSAGQPDFHLDTAPFVSGLCGNSRSCIPQPGTSVGLDSISDRLMYRLQYRNFGDHQSILATHTVNVSSGGNQAGVDWHEVRNTGSGWSIYQEGIYAPDSNNRWMSSGAMDVSGNIAIGYSVSSSTVYPSIRAAGRLAGDPLGQLTQGESELIAGTGSQTSGFSRWGDYSTMTVDPTDGCTFWYTNEYLTQTGDAPWQTRVGTLKFPSCSAGPHGTIAGVVTDANTTHPIPGAVVGAGTSSTTTDGTGHYQLVEPVGTYTMSASAFGYQAATASGVVVTNGGTTTKNFALAPLPLVTVSGTVKDGGGQGWPLYATITIAGVPNGTVYTDPVTGHYSIALPARTTYAFHVAANYPGYLPLDKSVKTGNLNLTQNFALGPDPATCSAPGYAPAFHGVGLYEAFDSGAKPPAWNVVDNLGNGQVWQFNDPHPRGNLTGGTGGFAIEDSDNYGFGGSQDSSLVSPTVNLTTATTPEISFFTDYRALHDVADVDLSLDGGATWNNVWHQTSDVRGPIQVHIAIPQAAHKANVQVRFHYYQGSFSWWWQVDDVIIGQGQVGCGPVPGGLVNGHVTDANTGAGLDGATVTSNDNPTDAAVTTAQPDPAVGHGWYWLFSHLTGAHPFTAAFGSYQPSTAPVSVAAHASTAANFALKAGHLTITPSTITSTQPMGVTRTAPLTISNDGTAPATVQITEQGGNFQIRGPQAPLHNVGGYFTPNRFGEAPPPPGKPAHAVTPPAPYAPPWTTIANYPTSIMDNAVATNTDGKVYSVGGFNGTGNVATAEVFDPGTGAWTAIASMSNVREKPASAFINGKLYVVGGWDSSGNPLATLEIYDPNSAAWSTGASIPIPYAAPGVAVLNGKMYVVGGCDAIACGHSDVFVYDPVANAWTSAAAYPNSTSWLGCGGLTGKLYCAGGTSQTSDTATAFAYDPNSNAWSPIANIPVDLWAMGYTAANGVLLLSGGVTNGTSTVTNMGFSYNPTSATWSPIPNSNNTVYRGGSACGFYRVGGSTGGFTPIPNSELLPGFGQCGGATNIPWLSEHPTQFTVQPGKSVTVTVTFDSSVSSVNQPGTYTGQLAINSNTPYSYPPVGVNMIVTPPPTWGKIAGTVAGLQCHGPAIPIAAATVQIDTWAATYTLLTDASGNYALWLDVRNNPLTMIVAKDGWQPQTTKATIGRLTTTTVNFKLKPDHC